MILPRLCNLQVVLSLKQKNDQSVLWRQVHLHSDSLHLDIHVIQTFQFNIFSDIHTGSFKVEVEVEVEVKVKVKVHEWLRKEVSVGESLLRPKLTNDNPPASEPAKGSARGGRVSEVHSDPMRPSPHAWLWLCHSCPPLPPSPFTCQWPTCSSGEDGGAAACIQQLNRLSWFYSNMATYLCYKGFGVQGGYHVSACVLLVAVPIYDQNLATFVFA